MRLTHLRSDVAKKDKIRQSGSIVGHISFDSNHETEQLDIISSLPLNCIIIIYQWKKIALLRGEERDNFMRKPN